MRDDPRRALAVPMTLTSAGTRDIARLPKNSPTTVLQSIRVVMKK
jgi:hypothetical protein